MIKFKPILLIFICFFFLLTACAVQPNPYVSEQSLQQENIKKSNVKLQTSPTDRKTVFVTFVQDGDTVQYIEDLNKDGNFEDEIKGNVKAKTARLIGINAPEDTHIKQLYGHDATLFLKHLILGKEIQIEGDPKADVTDKYGRYLIHAFLGEESVQYLLVAAGMAKVAYIFDDYKYIDLYRKAESIAEKSNLNIWSIPGYVDSANGYNMDVVTDNVKTKLQDGIQGILSSFK